MENSLKKKLKGCFLFLRKIQENEIEKLKFLEEDFKRKELILKLENSYHKKIIRCW